MTLCREQQVRLVVAARYSSWDSTATARSNILYHIYAPRPQAEHFVVTRKTSCVLHTYLLTYPLTTCSTVHLLKQTGFQLVKTLPAFLLIRKFIITFSSARQLSLSWVSLIQSIQHTPLTEEPLEYYPAMYVWVSPVFSFPHFPHASPFPHTRYMPHLSHSSLFYHPHKIGWAVQNIKVLIM